MPHFFSGAVSIGVRPHDLIRRLQKPSFDSQNDHGTGCRQVSCLPHRKGSKTVDGKDAVKKLQGDVEELMVTQEIMSVTFSAASGPSEAQTPPAPGGKYISEAEQKHVHEVSEDVHKQLNTILSLIRELSGDTNAKEHKAYHKRMPSDDVIETLEQLIAQDLPVQLLAQLPVLEFETRKDVMNMCCALLWPGMPQQIDKQVVSYLRYHSTVFKLLVDGYSNEETALHYGVVLRSCARHGELVEAFLCSGLMPELLRFAQHNSIDISSDAFYTLREMLLAHKELSARWLNENAREFFTVYNELLRSGDYIAERQAQKLLTEILLDRRFQKVMVLYVSDERNLQIHMNLLKDRSKVIKLEAFHVFKIFVANPQKPVRVQQILNRNKDKLVALLESLQTAKIDDKKVVEELRNVADKLMRMSPPDSPTTTTKVTRGPCTKEL